VADIQISTKNRIRFYLKGSPIFVQKEKFNSFWSARKNRKKKTS